jgi:hypothetical protein
MINPVRDSSVFIKDNAKFVHINEKECENVADWLLDECINIYLFIYFSKFI